jgi:hypothetical protein
MDGDVKCIFPSENLKERALVKLRHRWEENIKVGIRKRVYECV